MIAYQRLGVNIIWPLNDLYDLITFLFTFSQIGYRSMIRGSQSISDLTNAIETPNNSRLSEHSGAISSQGRNIFLLLYY